MAGEGAAGAIQHPRSGEYHASYALGCDGTHLNLFAVNEGEAAAQICHRNGIPVSDVLLIEDARSFAYVMFQADIELRRRPGAFRPPPAIGRLVDLAVASDDPVVMDAVERLYNNGTFVQHQRDGSAIAWVLPPEAEGLVLACSRAEAAPELREAVRAIRAFNPKRASTGPDRQPEQEEALQQAWERWLTITQDWEVSDPRYGLAH